PSTRRPRPAETGTTSGPASTPATKPRRARRQTRPRMTGRGCSAIAPGCRRRRRLAAWEGAVPKVFDWNGYRFHSYSNEGDPPEPPHIHVRKGRDDAKFWLRPEV